MLLVLDSGPLGLLSNPATAGPAGEARDWARERIGAGDRLVVPEIADYEVRRELLRARKARGIERLDDLRTLGYAPLTTDVMEQAAALWAEVRNKGVPTAHDHALDGDVILAAQARSLGGRRDVVVVTTNVKHLERFVDARLWTDV